jgi:nucleoside-diphosphate-sugar epimerase
LVSPFVVVAHNVFRQLGVDLVERLLSDSWRVICVCHRSRGNVAWLSSVEVVEGDVIDKLWLSSFLRRQKVDHVYHLAGVLSAGGESDPDRAWSVNVDSLRFILELAVELGFRLFWASSIAVFGPSVNLLMLVILKVFNL